MAELILHHLPQPLLEQLGKIARSNGRSLEEEVVSILTANLDRTVHAGTEQVIAEVLKLRSSMKNFMPSDLILEAISEGKR